MNSTCIRICIQQRRSVLRLRARIYKNAKQIAWQLIILLLTTQIFNSTFACTYICTYTVFVTLHSFPYWSQQIYDLCQHFFHYTSYIAYICTEALYVTIFTITKNTLFWYITAVSIRLSRVCFTVHNTLYANIKILLTNPNKHLQIRHFVTRLSASHLCDGGGIGGGLYNNVSDLSNCLK